MFARLPGVRAKDLIRALEKAGFAAIRQKGSHVTLHNDRSNITTVVPLHPGELPRWLLKKIIKDSGHSEEQFRMLL